MKTRSRASILQVQYTASEISLVHHITNLPTYFRDLTKSLTPEGRVAIIDFRKDSPEGPPVEFRFEAEQIVEEMEQAGYRLDVKHDFLPRQHFLMFRPATGSRPQKDDGPS
jgi:hypothetical protein